MFNAFWRFFVDLKVAEEYYLLHVQRAKRCERWINIFALTGSVAGILSFFSTWFHPATSAVIVLISQFASVIQPFYPFGDRVYAGTCIYKNVFELSLEAEQLINQCLYGNLDESTLFTSLGPMQDDFAKIEQGFASPDLFPRKSRLHKKAQENAAAYINSHFERGE